MGDRTAVAVTSDQEQVRRDAEQRYEVHALLGPCTYDEAEAFFEENSEDTTLGAVWSCGLYDDRDYRAELVEAARLIGEISQERDQARKSRLGWLITAGDAQRELNAAEQREAALVEALREIVRAPGGSADLNSRERKLARAALAAHEQAGT